MLSIIKYCVILLSAVYSRSVDCHLDCVVKLSVVKLSVIMLCVVMLCVIMLSVIMLSMVMLSVVMVSVVILSVVMLSVVVLSVVMLSVVAPFLLWLNNCDKALQNITTIFKMGHRHRSLQVVFCLPSMLSGSFGIFFKSTR